MQSYCWILTENIKQNLLVLDRKILRRIFGSTQKANGEWRLKINEELEEAINLLAPELFFFNFSTSCI
jgi:hypothetical protein